MVSIVTRKGTPRKEWKMMLAAQDHRAGWSFVGPIEYTLRGLQINHHFHLELLCAPMFLRIMAPVFHRRAVSGQPWDCPVVTISNRKMSRMVPMGIWSDQSKWHQIRSVEGVPTSGLRCPVTRRDQCFITGQPVQPL